MKVTITKSAAIPKEFSGLNPENKSGTANHGLYHLGDDLSLVFFSSKMGSFPTIYWRESDDKEIRKLFKKNRIRFKKRSREKPELIWFHEKSDDVNPSVPMTVFNSRTNMYSGMLSWEQFQKFNRIKP